MFHRFSHVPLRRKRLAAGYHHPKGGRGDQHPTIQPGPCSLDLKHNLWRWRERSFGADVRVFCTSREMHSKRHADSASSRSQWTTNVQCVNLTDISTRSYGSSLVHAITKCSPLFFNLASKPHAEFSEYRRCESCIDRLFTLGPAPCPICQTTLRKLAFIPQTFEDLTVEKEVAVRRRMAKEFNKRREDFIDLKSYNDYLEEVEDISE